MAEFFRNSTTWVIDFRYDGSPRRWFRVFELGADVPTQVAASLHDLYGEHAKLVQVREATSDEETLYLHGDEPRNRSCPTGR